MATNLMAQMLDELMGKDRDLLPDEASRHKDFDDPEVCKYYLCGFCPHDLFTNTKTDLGPCTGMHDDSLVEMYKKSSKRRKMGYEEEYLKFLQSIKNDCEKRIKRANQRLAQAPNQNLGNPKTSSLQIIENKITALLERVETLGSEGRVEEAQGLMREIDKLRKDREDLQSHIMIDNPNEKQMEVCTICGAFLIVGDAPSRVEDHMKGKQHTGFAKVRETIAQLREELYNIREDDSKERISRGRSTSNSPARRRRRSNSSSASRPSRNTHSDYSEMLQKESDRRNIQPTELPESERPRKSNHKSRSRSRSRKKVGRRSRSRERSRRDRSKSRKRERSGRRSRDKRRSRSRSKDRKSKRDSSRKSRKSKSRSRDRKSHGRRRHSSENSGERIEVKVPVNADEN